MTDETTRRRMLFVHAHPDDETLATGVALAHYARRGHDVHLLTCTLGEEGEIIPADLSHLAAAAEDQLGPYRRGELTAAMAHLGVTMHVLGDEGGRRYRDSGMAGTASMEHPDAFAGADLAEVATAVREVIVRLHPEVVVSYEDQGGYRHPDHIRTHDAVVAALAGLAPDERPAMFAVVTPRSWAVDDRAWVRAHAVSGATEGLTVPDPDEPFPAAVVEDDVVTHAVLGSPEDLAARDAALREHRTQVSLYQGCYALSNRVMAKLATREGYLRWDPVARTARPGSAGGIPSSGGPTGGRPGLLDEPQPQPVARPGAQEGPA